MASRAYNALAKGDNAVTAEGGQTVVLRLPTVGAGSIRRMSVFDSSLVKAGFTVDVYDNPAAFATDISDLAVNDSMPVVLADIAPLHKVAPTLTVAALATNGVQYGDWLYCNNQVSRNESTRELYVVIALAGTGAKVISVAIIIEPIDQ